MKRSLVLGMAGMAVAAGIGATTVVADTFPHVTANVDITDLNKSPVRDDAIPEVTVDPNNPKHIVVLEGDFRTGSCLIHVSLDGGATFTVAKRSPLPPQFERCTPNAASKAFAMAWGQDGSLLVAIHVLNGTATVRGGPADLVVSRTSDNGTSWQSVVVAHNGASAQAATPAATPAPSPSPSPSAKPGATAAPPPKHGVWGLHLASDRHGDVVAAWWETNVTVPGVKTTENRAEIAVSKDDGATFGSPIDVAGLTADSLPARAPSAVFAPDGSLFLLAEQSSAPKGAPATATPSLVVYRTTDLGQTFQMYPIQATSDFTSNPELGIAPTAGGGYVAVAVFEELAPGAEGRQQVRDIYASRSTDQGKTWAPRQRVTDDPPTDYANKFVPGISAAPDGRIDVAWEDFRDDNGNLLTNVYESSSTDGGVTWGPNIRVSDHPSNRHYGQFANYSDVRGAVGVSSDNYAAYIAWDDSRNATPDKPAQDVYFAAVQMAPLPAASSDIVLRIVAAIAGGLIAGGLLLGAGALVLRRRRRNVPPAGARAQPS